MHLWRTVASLLLIGAIAGCDGSSRRSSPATAPATPLAQAPATEPLAVTLIETPSTAPATQPGMATLVIGQQGFWFPPTTVRLSSSHGTLVARLMTDDPPAAIEENYHGNSIDLNMPLTITDRAQLNQAAWKYAATSNDRTDNSPHGIFLDGQRRRLHPRDVTVQFQEQNGKVALAIRGWFLLDESAGADHPFTVPRRVFVEGRLDATLAGQ